jgi:CBS domain-containing protein
LAELAKITLKDFVDKQNRDVIAVTMKTKASKAVKMASSKGVHRIFVVNAEKKPIGVISLVDIIYLFFRHILIE